MKKLSLYFAFLTISISTIGQSCLPNDSYFNTQSEIDDFYTNNPNCTTIKGNLMIMGSDITNLNGLQNITTFEQGLWIEDCPLLESFSGLKNVTYIGDYLEIGNLPLIEDFSEFSNLSYVGGALDIIILPSLTNINGLENVTSAITHLILWGNENLADLEGINNIQSISTQLRLGNNTTLTDIGALENIDLSELQLLTLKGNSQLSECEIHNICNYLSASIGEIDIESNMIGCNNQIEVETACQVGLAESENNIGTIVYPNPANGILHINYTGNQVKEITIYNELGLKVLHKREKLAEIDISNLNSGIYYIELNINDLKLKKKLIVKK